jgi:hypothetical protein
VDEVIARLPAALCCVLAFVTVARLGSGRLPATFTYSVAFRGRITADKNAFAQTVALAYADPRGWSLNHEVIFRRVQRGGNFTVWLASPDQMKSFSSECSPAWSCRTGRNVVINQDRWMYGSPFWYGPLAAYRVMIVNHETGHWFGLGHQACAASGSPAPVMMQQSEGATPCENNVWPLPSERDVLAKMLGLPKPT